MASATPPSTWQNGYQQPAAQGVAPHWSDAAFYVDQHGQKAHYDPGDEALLPTTETQNVLGKDYVNKLRSWPDIYDGAVKKDSSSWSKKEEEVDVLIAGAGPFGLQIAVGLLRQGLTFRIIDIAERPCLSGRADGLHPRALEHLQSWGLAQEMSEVGPILNSTVLHYHGAKMFHDHSSVCDSRYKGIHILTQGQIEKVYIRDLRRHGVLVQRSTCVDAFAVAGETEHPVQVTLKNIKTGTTETLRAKHLVGADGAGSKIREQLNVPFNGLATGAYWAIMDCKFKTDFPYIIDFNILVSEHHGSCIIIPREDGYTRIYISLVGENLRKLGAAREARRQESTVGVTRVEVHDISPDETLEQLRLMIAPHKIDFASPMSWFAIWHVNERVARSFTSPDLRVHLGGDAAHVHSVLGAFGLNSSVYDAANLSWKLGLSIRGAAKPHALLPTYDNERRLFANRVIRCSGAYLRFICKLDVPLAQLRGLGEDLEVQKEELPVLDGTVAAAGQWLGQYFKQNAFFLLGVEEVVTPSVICPETPAAGSPTSLINGVRAPSPRVALHASATAYLYDLMPATAKFHILVFGSDLQGPVATALDAFVHSALRKGSFYDRFGGRDRFQILLLTKLLPHEVRVLQCSPSLESLMDMSTVVFDDKTPDEDAHYWYGVNHARGAVVIVRPDLRIATSLWLEDGGRIAEYFAGFLNEVPIVGQNGVHQTNGVH